MADASGDSSSAASLPLKSSFSSFKSSASSGDVGGDRRSQRHVEFSEDCRLDSAGLAARRLTSSGAAALPRYAGSSFSAADRPAHSYRLASLDRLAQRHKLYTSTDTTISAVEQNGSPSPAAPASAAAPTGPASNGNGMHSAAESQSPPHLVAATTSIISTATLQNKREMFFRGEPAAPASASPSPAAAVASKDSHSSNHHTSSSTATAAIAVAHHTNGRENKENRPEVAPKPDAHPTHSQSSTAAAESSTNGSSRRTVEELTRERDRQLRDRRARQLDGYVGFANLPNQVYRRAVKRGFHFTLMCVGESGLGKSTLVNSMFMTDIYSVEHPGPSHRIKKTVAVDKTVVKLKENGVNLTLTVVDTPGFGDAVDNSNCWQPVIDYIECQYEEYLNAESRVRRTEIVDNRVHCCIYFIAPSGHNLKPLDVEFMKRLHDKVNIIPVIAKADTMTPEEVARFKRQVMSEIAQHKIKIYEFPDCDDDEENRAQQILRDRVPFAVVGANTVIEIDGKKVRGRRYPWGVVQVENMEHSDFIPLRNMLIRTHMMDLRAVTNSVHYENYRCKTLAGLGADGKTPKIANKNPLAQMEEEKREHELKMKKMEAEMEQVFEMKVREKKNKIKESEEDLEKRERQMLGPLEEQRRQMQERRATFERERAEWEQQHGVSVMSLRRKELETNGKELVDGKKKKKGLF